MIRLIAAADDNFGIGRKGGIPWDLPPDLARFAKLTKNSTVIMGRATADSLPGWLPNRYNIVITNQMPVEDTVLIQAKKLTIRYMPSLEAALTFSGYDCWVIGGEKVYEQAIHYADRLYLTRVYGDFDCDRFFPDIPDEFVEIDRESHLDAQPIAYEYITFDSSIIR